MGDSRAGTLHIYKGTRTMNKIKTTILGLMAMAAVTASASRAGGLPRTVTLDNGRVVTVRLVGSQDLHFFVTADGEVVMEEGGKFRLASTLEVENIRAMAQQPAAESANALPFGVMPYASTLDAAGDAAAYVSDESITGQRILPSLGTPKILTVMVDFQNLGFRFSAEDVDALLNSREYNTTNRYRSYGSVAQYFEDCSFGQYRPQFDIVASFTLDNDYEHYGRPTGNRTDNTTALLTDVCKKLAEYDIDFDQYDADNDGYIDMVYIVYAGYSEAMGAGGDCLWPTSGYQPMSVSLGNKGFFRYSIQNELFGTPDTEGRFPGGNPITGIGVHVHEYCHAMGLPDYYPTIDWFDGNGYYDVYKYDNQSMELWDLMDGGENINNGLSPAPLSAWQRELFGWTDKMEILSEPANVALTPIKDGGAGVRIVNDENPNEFWILENLPKETVGWYAQMPGSGMLITHVDYDKTLFNALNMVNNTPGHPDITVMPADGWLPSIMREFLPAGNPDFLSYSRYVKNHAGDTYPLLSDTLVVTEFTDYKAYTGTVDKPITDITKLDDGTVAFKFMGGTVLLGDVNGDGVITIADANAIVNYYLGNDVENFNMEAADVNGDGDITIADANAIVNIFLEE